MKTEVACPKCGAAADPTNAKCPACGVELLAAFESRAWGRRGDAFGRPAPRRLAAPARAAWLLAAALAAGIGAAMFLRGLWVLRGPGAGAPLPERAYVDAARRFAFAPPSGWQLELLDESCGAGLTRAARLARGATTIEVCVGDAAAAQAGDAALLERAFSGAEMKVVSSDRQALDGLPGRRVWGSAGRAYMPSSSAGRTASSHHQPAPKYESVELSAFVVAANDARASYILKFFSEKSQLEADRSDLERFLASFRVLDRPWAP